MGKTLKVQARIEPELKNEAEDILKKVGVSVTEAIRLYYRQIVIRKGIPFDVAIYPMPNKETREAL